MSSKTSKTIAFYEVHWKNGRTDIQVRKLKKGYRVIDHCHENLTPDGTLVNMRIREFYEARGWAVFYANFLLEKGGFPEKSGFRLVEEPR